MFILQALQMVISIKTKVVLHVKVEHAATPWAAEQK
jgi:hypothetical protein